MPTRTLSSRFTIFYKIIMPGFFLGMFGLGTACLWLGLMRGQHGELPPPAMKWIFLAILIVAAVFIILAPSRLKQVRAGNDCLYVSNYRQEISIPFSMIKDVREQRYVRGNPVIIYLRQPMEFGDQIMFMPGMKLALRGWNKPHPVVNELKQWAGLSDSA